MAKTRFTTPIKQKQKQKRQTNHGAGETLYPAGYQLNDWEKEPNKKAPKDHPKAGQILYPTAVKS